MSPDLPRSDRKTPPFVKPFLRALDRMREPEAHSPDDLKARAKVLLDERLGPSAQPVETAFTHGAIGLLSDQTHYSNGFALLMPIRQGTAIAVRRAEKARSRLIFERSKVEWTLDGASEEAPPWMQVVMDVAEQLGPVHHTEVDIAVVSTIPALCLDAYLSALAVVATQALRAVDPHALHKPSEDTVEALLPALRKIIADRTGLPFSAAYPIAAYVGNVSTFTLVDTATGEYLPVETAARDELGWSLVMPREPSPSDMKFHQWRRDQADEAIALLQENGFEQLKSFRELEHRTLPRALDVLPSHLHPVVRHLVTENRRVQKMVAALRQEDWQMVGALLLMSHASRRDDWADTSEASDFIVEQIETMTMASIYGASMAGRGGHVVMVGRPVAVPSSIDQLNDSFREHFGYVPKSMML